MKVNIGDSMGRIVIDQSNPEVIKELQKLCPFNAFEVKGELIMLWMSCL